MRLKNVGETSVFDPQLAAGFVDAEGSFEAPETRFHVRAYINVWCYIMLQNLSK